MIRRKEEMRQSTSAKAHGEVAFTHFMEPAEADHTGRLFAKITIGPGGSLDYHGHQGEFEAFYLISGTAIVNDNGTEAELRAGDMHLCRSGEAHGIRNGSSEPMEMVAIILNAKGDPA